jgi:hypothetical protein
LSGVEGCVLVQAGDLVQAGEVVQACTWAGEGGVKVAAACGAKYGALSCLWFTVHSTRDVHMCWRARCNHYGNGARCHSSIGQPIRMNNMQLHQQQACVQASGVGLQRASYAGMSPGAFAKYYSQYMQHECRVDAPWPWR